MEQQFVDYALKYAQKGWRVFPLRPGDKTPMVAEWQKQATTEENTILGWWEQWPDANIGVATGAQSGIFALDLDGEFGLGWMNGKENSIGPAPITPVSNTGKGGKHYLFQYPANTGVYNSASLISKDVDIRGEGGYIVVPPSIHPNGTRYQWDRNRLPSQTDVAVAPDWLMDEIRKSKDKKPAPAPTDADGVYGDGSRNETLTSLGGSMRRRGLGFNAILAALKAENSEKCVPPLPDKEVEKIARSVMRYNPTDAPALTERDRATAEWGFAKAVYLVPDYTKEFLWLEPRKIANDKISKFWKDLLDGKEAVQAATDAGILTDLENLTSDVSKVEGYAETIDRYGYFDSIRKFAGELDRAAGSGDVSKVDKVVGDIAKNVQPTTGKGGKVAILSDVLDSLEARIKEREQNPTDVWGIPFSPHWGLDRRDSLSWKTLSRLTGGKQNGELLMIAGEPAVGKSWFAIQDVLMTAIADHPVFIWSGEMRRDQVISRMMAIMGVNSRNMKTGRMTDRDWEIFNEARAYVQSSPIFINDQAGIPLHELKALIYRQKMENGIEQFLIDYNMLVNAGGKDDIENSAIVSRELKILCQELDVAGVLIGSVTKTGMDGSGPAKSNMRGSGQQVHDADVIFYLTHFQKNGDNDPVTLRYCPDILDERLITLWITKGRELDAGIPGGRLHFARMKNSPAFREEPAVLDPKDEPFVNAREECR